MTTNCPDASSRTHSGLRKMIGCADAAARNFNFLLLLLILLLILICS